MTNTIRSTTLLIIATFVATFTLLMVGSTAAHASGCAFPVYNSKGQVVGCVGGGDPGNGGGGGSSSGGSSSGGGSHSGGNGGGHTTAPKPTRTYHPQPTKTYTPPAKDYCPSGDYTGSRYDGWCGHAPVQHKVSKPKPMKQAPVKKAKPAPKKSTPAPTVIPTPTATPSPVATPSAAPVHTAPRVQVQNAAHLSKGKGNNTGGILAAGLAVLLLLGGAAGVLFYRKRKGA